MNFEIANWRKQHVPSNESMYKGSWETVMSFILRFFIDFKFDSLEIIGKSRYKDVFFPIFKGAFGETTLIFSCDIDRWLCTVMSPSPISIEGDLVSAGLFEDVGVKYVLEENQILKYYHWNNKDFTVTIVANVRFYAFLHALQKECK